MKPSNSVVRPAFGGHHPHLDPNAAHARIYSDWRHLEAFKTLAPLQRCVLEDILLTFNKHQGNETRLTANGIRQRYSVSHNTARRAISGLEDRGWIERIRLGPGPTGQAGGVYRILCIDSFGFRIRGPYMKWRPVEGGN